MYPLGHRTRHIREPPKKARAQHEPASRQWSEGDRRVGNRDVMNRGRAVMNDTFSAMRAPAILTHAGDARIVRGVKRRSFIPAPLLFVIATAFGISSTFQAYWMDRLSPHTHPMQDAFLHLLALNLLYWYIPALVAPTIMRFALRHPFDGVRWPQQVVLHIGMA